MVRLDFLILGLELHQLGLELHQLGMELQTRAGVLKSELTSQTGAGVVKLELKLLKSELSSSN
jgi:hypothetical protein